MPHLRHRLIFVLALLAIGAAAEAAGAGVRVRVGVRPDALVHCGRGQLAFALWNDGADPLRVRIYLSLAHEDTALFGPRPFRAVLEPHQLHRREFEFPVPPIVPTGRYTLRVLAVASDSTQSEAVADFVVASSECTIGDAPDAPVSLLLDGIAAGIGLDVPTPTIRASWGAIKRRYDSKQR